MRTHAHRALAALILAAGLPLSTISNAAGAAPEGEHADRSMPGELGEGAHSACRDPALSAFADTVSFAVPVFEVTGSGTFATAIPAGARLAVELVSAHCEVPPAITGAGAPIDFGVTALLAGVAHTYHLALTLVASNASHDYYTGNLQGGFYADPGGTQAFIRYAVPMQVGTANCSVSLSGRLVQP